MSDGLDEAVQVLHGMEPTMSGPIGVLLAIFDFPMLAAGYRLTIDDEQDMRVVGVVEQGASLAEVVSRQPADVTIVDCLSYADVGGSPFSAIDAIRSVRPESRIIVLDRRCAAEQFSLALKAGADGFLDRRTRPADVLNAIRCVRRGETYVCPALVTQMVNTYVLRNDARSLEDPYESLSDREREVLLLAAVGHTNREIAQTLHLSEQTIHNYRANIMEKLGFHDRVELLKFALRRGVIAVADA
ncbi:MAG TPA: response regulator transcription factor [Candidatus Dormibacteraeota bacterium]|nr:response regulator transcription factor [Candidatus Dormibacteraeota bacterium]